MSDDDKHKLYQAAGMSGDTEQIRRVSTKIGLMNDDFTTNDAYVPFIEEHAKWAYRNGDFILSLNTKEKALAYVNEHLPDWTRIEEEPKVPDQDDGSTCL